MAEMSHRLCMKHFAGQQSHKQDNVDSSPACASVNTGAIELQKKEHLKQACQMFRFSINVAIEKKEKHRCQRSDF